MTLLSSILTLLPVTTTGNQTIAGVKSFSGPARSAVVALTDGATITPDFSLSNTFSVTLGGNRTLANPTNIDNANSQSGSIFITQDGTGSRTLAYGNLWKFDSGVAPTLTTTAGAVDRLDYITAPTGTVHALLSKDVK